MNEIALEQYKIGNLLVHFVDTAQKESQLDNGVMRNYYKREFGLTPINSFYYCLDKLVNRDEAITCLDNGISVKQSTIFSSTYEDFFRHNAPELIK